MSQTRRDGHPNRLYCPTSPRCDHPWHYDIRINGRRYRASTETANKHQARDIEARERARILEGRHGIRRQPDITLRRFWPIFRDTYAKVHHRATTLDREKHIWRTLDRHLGAMILHQISAFTVEQYKSKRLAEGVQPATAARELLVLSSMLRRAVEWDHLAAMPSMKIPRSVGQRTRILTPEEQQRLLEAYDRGRRVRVKPLIQLLLATGARLGEILSLKWRDIQRGYLWLHHTKNGKPRRLPVTPEIAGILASVPKRGPSVFVSFRTGNPYRGILTGFKAALRDAGITSGDVVIHTLRHTAISRMMDANIDPRTIMEISGHSSLAMLERYTHPREQRKIEALEAINRPLLGTTRSQSETEVAVSRRAASGTNFKVPHHGSAGSSSAAFVAATRPDLAVVSAGRANQFGHPAPEVVRRYLDRGARVLNTAADGAITIETDGRTVEVSTMTGRTMTLSPAP
ncbi:MAG: tyrosine-type recombinase/integrase [Vicinamibacterales bacterium]|nr:hypothetical protein [Acidobacteriota bacterium]MDP6374102.1 tyrosine-type recombinase/integrase [Vicinamibacterales bacterium]MDP6610394.1 tyrosine-type recombinase/integrase [Vicinamibacterales bacterium]